jgi:protoheme IX farnesyltransferase
MDKVEIASSPQFVNNKPADRHTVASIFYDLNELFKGLVLMSNVLPVFAGFWLALYFTDASIVDYWGTLLITLIGSTFVMAGALVFNNWYEVDLDTAMKRTKNRPTVTGNFSLNTVLTMGISLTVLGFIVLLFTTLETTVYALIGWFTYVVLYTFWTKRKYAMNTIIGSVSGAVTPLIGWAAVDSAFHVVPIVLFLLMFIWQVPHTFSIAMKRYDEYKAAGVPMHPVVYGFASTKRQVTVYIACLLPLPFYLTAVGTPFVVLTTLMNIGWLAIAIRGFFTKNDVKWARMIFVYSLGYLTIFFLFIIVVTSPIFG